MAGHSRWANIKRKKGTLDARRGKIFTKLVKEITIASRLGGPDPDSNSRLRLAIQNARGANVSKDTIERAIKKGSGNDGTVYTEISYEGYAAHGVPVFIECTTDNLNRTVQNVRVAFSKCGGNLGTNGSLEFIFTRKGVFTFPKPGDLDEENFTLDMIDAGADEVEFEEGYVTVTCSLQHFGSIQKALEEKSIEPESAGLQRIPNTYVKLGNEELQKVMKLIEMLEDDDDVQKVYHNIELSEEQVSLL
ncbi:MAG: YebC/PmpR family DNA-binding transcriptional regulator [Cytophagaceae bacterium]|nr:YebC/PmpR family DNA-binding transcriptional regulator [Cytophagaceae bacterium]